MHCLYISLHSVPCIISCLSAKLMRVRKPAFTRFMGVIVAHLLQLASSIVAEREREMSSLSSERATDPRLINTVTKTVHKLTQGTKYLLASHSHLFPPSLDTQSSSLQPSLPILLPPPLKHNEQYCCQLEVNEDGGCCLLSVWVGDCYLNGNKIESPVSLDNDILLKLGNDLELKYYNSSENVLPRRRLLPQTPGQLRSEDPPTKPTRTQPQSLESLDVKEEISSFKKAAELDPALRERLKRIAREVNSRDSGIGRSKPPPPYEQVGNSIGYQLLLQHHGHYSNMTSVMIDSLYPMLKYMQLKEQSLEQFYKDYLEQYSAARKRGATPTNMHPEDIPTIVFIVDTLIHLCSLPRVNELAVRYCPVWMKLLSVFSHSYQNQVAIATKRLATKVVSCMGLGIMSDQPEFHALGWTVLTNVVTTPTQRDNKPALPEPAIALALPLVQRQLHHYGNQLSLAQAILGFLSCLACTVKHCQMRGNDKDKDEEEEEVYTAEQASRILQLLSEHNILRHVMKVPQQIRKDSIFDNHYCVLVKALVPTRKVGSKPLSSVQSASTLLIPPAKPKRIKRATTEGSLKTSRKSRKSRKSIKQIVEEHHINGNTKGEELTRSLSEEKLTKEHDLAEEEEEELKGMRSEGESDGELEENQVEKRLQEMRDIKNQILKENKNEDSDNIKNETETESPTPLSPDSLAGDIANTLAEVRQPVRQYSLKRNPGQPEVHVPNIPINTSYYQTSFKRKSLQSPTEVNESKSVTHRLSWLPASPPIFPLDHTHPLETSSEHNISSVCNEEIQCGHEDVCTALAGRLELMKGVWSLWKDGRGLQAATNCVRGCFSDDIHDPVLFCDLLKHFHSIQSQSWTLAVCVVLLPVIAQLLKSHRHNQHTIILANVLSMIIKRFSPSILSCKKTSNRKPLRVSATSDLQQRTTCYTALHMAWIAVEERLKSSNMIGQDNGDVISILSELRSSLTPFNSELN